MIATLSTRRRSTGPDVVAAHLAQLNVVDDPVEYLFSGQFSKLQEAAHRLDALIDSVPEDSYLIYGRLAATEKRIAELYAQTDAALRFHNASRETLPDYLSHAETHLSESARLYASAFAANRDAGWALIQQLVLEVVLGRNLDEVWTDRWTLARLLSEAELSQEDSRRRVWATANLIELHLLASEPSIHGALSGSKHAGVATPAMHLALAEARARAVTEQTQRNSLERGSIARQVARYMEVFRQVNDARFAQLESASEGMLTAE